ncbi:MAG: hypothetical protein HGA49_00120 [Eubacteriaceae bacterium]|nr:hypothetical protein [Eubacteriaceae bacterium]
MEKAEYFPRKKLFEEVQDLISTFYSTGDYFSEQVSNYESMLSRSGERDEFYYSLYLLSTLSNVNDLIKLAEKIIRNMNMFRVRRKVTSTEDFSGEIDIEEYTNKNHIDRVIPREYPSIIKYSTFQLPEYQLTLYILKRCEDIYRSIFAFLGDNTKISFFKYAHKHYDKIQSMKTILLRRYGISYDRRETYLTLKKKVVYRYNNRKIINDSYIRLMSVFEKIISFGGIDFDSRESIEIFDHYESFDDRLFEIWLIRQSAKLVAENMRVKDSDIEYVPLFKARNENKFAVSIDNGSYRIEILFQNRKKFMPRDDLKWYWNNDGKKEEIGAIPDLIFLKYMHGSKEPAQIVLVDAKNRKWTFRDDMQRIKAEIVQQVYIHDNFIALFEDRYKSILVAHNIEEYQTRKYNHKDKMGYEIDVVSLNFSEGMLTDSLKKYAADLFNYLEM